MGTEPEAPARAAAQAPPVPAPSPDAGGVLPGLLAAAPERVLAMQRTAGNRATSAFLTRAAARPAEPPQEGLEARRAAVAAELGVAIRHGIAKAVDGEALQREQIDNQRGVAGEVSDWLNEAQPPPVEAWNGARSRFMRAAELLAAGDLRGAYINLAYGARSLEEARTAWLEYMSASIEGAGRTAGTLEIVRDAAFAAELALVTGGMGATALATQLGSGALATAGGTLLGIGVTAETVSRGDGAVSHAVRTTTMRVR